MSTPTLILGNNKWAIEEDSILGYAVEDRNGSYLPREISFTRGSDATFTESTGVIRQACWNLIQYSEQFNNAYWTKLNATISADTTTDPSGTTTADSIIESSINGIQEIYRSPAPTVAGTYTYSIYVKNLTGTRFLNLSASATASSDYVSVRFSPSTESLSSVNVSGSFSNGSAFYTAIGNGWYRVVLTFTTTLPPVPQVALSTDGSNGNVGGYGVQTYTGNGTSGLYIWGAQLVQGSDALGYLRTTNRLDVPRVDSSTGTKAFLLEPQRTNIALRSEEFDNASWLKLNSTVTGNVTTSPDGITNADKLFENATNGFHATYQTTNSTLGFFTATCYAKASERSWLILDIFTGASGGDCLAWFDLSNGVVGSTTNGNGSSSTTSTIQNVGNGWYRCSITINKTSATVGNFSIALSTGNNVSSYAGNSSNGIFIYGAQLEAGAYPTTYIPTTSATATRIADTSRTTGRSSLIGQSEGTLFIDLYYLPLQNQGRAIAITETSTPLTNRLIISINNTNNRVSVISRQSSTLTNGSMSESAATVLLNGRNKIALGYKSGDSALYINGVSVATNTDAFTFSATLNDIFLMTGEISLVADNVGFVYSSALFQTRLTNAELATITTL